MITRRHKYFIDIALWVEVFNRMQDIGESGDLRFSMWYVLLRVFCVMGVRGCVFAAMSVADVRIWVLVRKQAFCDDCFSVCLGSDNDCDE